MNPEPIAILCLLSDLRVALEAAQQKSAALQARVAELEGELAASKAPAAPA